jgi:hypothetical protein
MIIRSCSRCSRTLNRPLSRWRAHQGRPLRKYTTSSAPASSVSPPPSSFSVLGSVTSELDKLSPRFEIQPSQIQILKSPNEFYETLKVRLIILLSKCHQKSSHLQMSSLSYPWSLGSFLIKNTDDDQVGQNIKSAAKNLSVNFVYRQDRA